MTLGQARLNNGHLKYIHIIDLDEYDRTLNNLGQTLNLIQDPDVDILKNTTLAKFRNLQTKLRTLYPKSRAKRGLVNGLGTVIKTITGNMDAEDANRLNELIQEIKLNEHDLNTQQNTQAVLNQQMINRFKALTDYINQQHKAISLTLNNNSHLWTNEIYREDRSIQLIQSLQQINFNLDLLTNHLTDISEAIILAKLNIISKLILHPDELSYIRQLFQNMSFPLNNDQHIYELLQLQAYYSDNHVIFNLNIPLISPETYQFTHLIQIPVRNTETISVKYPFLAYNDRYLLYFTDRCNKVEQTFICAKPIFQEPTNSSVCIGNILNGKDASCPHTEMPATEKVITLEDNFILVTNGKAKSVPNTCGTPNIQIQGSILIKFENCTITINNVTYSNVYRIHWDNIRILPVMFKIINKTSILRKLTLEKLQDYHFENSNQIELVELKIQKQSHIFYLVFAIFITTTTVLLCKKYKGQYSPRAATKEPTTIYASNIPGTTNTNMAPVVDPTLRINWTSPI